MYGRRSFWIQQTHTQRKRNEAIMKLIINIAIATVYFCLTVCYYKPPRKKVLKILYFLSVGSYGLKVLAENIKMGENSSSSMPEMGTRLAGFRSSSRPDSVKVDSC